MYLKRKNFYKTITMPNVLFTLVVFYLVHNDLICTKKIEEIFTCANETECDELGEEEINMDSTVKEGSNALGNTSTTPVEDIYNTTTSSTSIHTTEITETSTISTSPTPFNIMPHNNQTRNTAVRKTESSLCECDLTTSSCDINCCCDKDCNDFHLTVFSHCGNYHAELYDRRYCYNRNFIDRNNTPFVLEKLANNLFCILYDNLPPTYTANNDLNIKSESDLKQAVNVNKLSWRWENQLHVPEYNISSFYQDGDIIWKLHKNYIEPLELPQSGFTGLCTFKKTLKYLHKWEDSCLQTEMNNSNKYLFPSTFNNFTIMISPHLFKESYTKLSNETCPRNMCLPLTNYYCHNSWNTCNNTTILGSCSNGICHNVVLGIRYLIVHNGSMGIVNATAYFQMGNISNSFYQHFEVIYEWAGLNKEKSFDLSGNPGYIFGKPLIIGQLKVNKTDNKETQYISFNKTNSFLTLPISQKNGDCNKFKRYTVAFGEDIKLKCSVSVLTNNFSTSSCIELQNRTMHFLMENSLFNITQVNQYGTYVSKSGNFTRNDTSDWTQILLDRVPHNVVTGQQINNRLHCSGLVTSVHLNILYSVLSKPETLTNYNILGVGIKFSDESDLSWRKCLDQNCTDRLKVDTINYVTFHDVSKPSKYYFVGGPSLDITLPYDFFYPFLSCSVCIAPSALLIGSVVLNVILRTSFY